VKRKRRGKRRAPFSGGVASASRSAANGAYNKRADLSRCHHGGDMDGVIITSASVAHGALFISIISCETAYRRKLSLRARKRRVCAAPRWRQ